MDLKRSNSWTWPLVFNPYNYGSTKTNRHFVRKRQRKGSKFHFSFIVSYIYRRVHKKRRVYYSLRLRRRINRISHCVTFLITRFIEAKPT